MMEIRVTNDGSNTLYSVSAGECYHSVKGAIEESLHVFINAGLSFVNKPNINILEIGFGTGLNALLTLQYAKNNKLNVYYEGIEAFPLNNNDLNALNYPYVNDFTKLHNAQWNQVAEIDTYFKLKKINQSLQNFNSNTIFDVMYFDAFSPQAQPEMWTDEVFEMLYSLLSPQGILVTYSSKGIVKQRLKKAGFTITRLPGAGGKRHMIRAVKP